jgi:hypothetical protein
VAKQSPLWWLSFADPDKPPGQAFLGVAIVHAYTDSVVAAAAKAHDLGCNPGGEVVGYWIEEPDSIPASHIGRLLSEAVAYSLTVPFYQQALDQGCRSFFVVQVRGDRVVADCEQPALFREWQRPH